MIEILPKSKCYIVSSHLLGPGICMTALSDLAAELWMLRILFYRYVIMCNYFSNFLVIYLLPTHLHITKKNCAQIRACSITNAYIISAPLACRLPSSAALWNAVIRQENYDKSLYVFLASILHIPCASGGQFCLLWYFCCNWYFHQLCVLRGASLGLTHQSRW